MSSSARFRVASVVVVLAAACVYGASACAGPSCGSAASVEIVDVAGFGASPCTVTFTNGGTNAIYTFPSYNAPDSGYVADAGGLGCDVDDDSPSCEAVEGPPITCKRGANCLDLAPYGDQGVALEKYLGGSSYSLSATCGDASVVSRTGGFGCITEL